MRGLLAKAQEIDGRTSREGSGGHRQTKDPVTQYFRHYTGGIGQEMVQGEEAVESVLNADLTVTPEEMRRKIFLNLDRLAKFRECPQDIVS